MAHTLACARSSVSCVELAATHAQLRERPIEHLPGGADERATLLVLPVARLLAHREQPRARPALAEDGLHAELVQLAAHARGRGLAQHPQAPRVGYVDDDLSARVLRLRRHALRVPIAPSGETALAATAPSRTRSPAMRRGGGRCR
jgi:hypothetical protein